MFAEVACFSLVNKLELLQDSPLSVYHTNFSSVTLLEYYSYEAKLQCTRGGTRTLTTFLPVDFESTAYTNSATRA